jgi:hypothetical protein
MAHSLSRKPLAAIFIALALTILTTSLVFAASGDISTLAGDGTPATTGDGGASTSAQVSLPRGLGVDSSGSVYIAEYLGHVLRKVDSSGNISTIAGTGTGGYNGDGGLAVNAQLKNPHDVMADGSGNVYIADRGNHRIRMIDSSGNISTIAGTGTAGYNGDGGLATSAQLNNPSGLGMDTSGNIYIADASNDRIRKIDSSGNISTVAGTGVGGFSGDTGPATSAQLDTPQGLKVNNAGEIFIADASNHRVRKVGTSGNITTIAGTGTPGLSGDGGPGTSADLKYPVSIELGPSGGIYVADALNYRIRLIDGSGDITTVAGTTQGFSGDGGPATSAQMDEVYGVTTGTDGTLYIADTGNNRVRAVEGTTTAPSVPGVTTWGMGAMALMLGAAMIVTGRRRKAGARA